MIIEGYRNAGSRHGGTLTEPLIGESTPAALARLGAELDATAQRLAQVRATIPYRGDLALGDLIQVADALHGDWIGRLTAIEHTITLDQATTTLTLEHHA